MYGKIFASMYRGTLYGHWEAIVTMQQLIVLADADGIVDMTPQAIAAHTSIPLDIITKGISKLEEADPYSRTPGEDGRRIVGIDEHRPWGWQIVNYSKYKHLKDSGEVREQNRVRAQRFRDKRNDTSRDVTLSNAESRHTDTDTDTDIDVKSTVGLKPDHAHAAVEILSFLNTKAGKHYKPVKQNLDLIVGLLKAGATPDDIRAVIAKKVREWNGREGMNEYLRPATLFGPKNFWQKYEGELGATNPPKVPA